MADKIKPKVAVVGRGNVAWHLMRALMPVAEVHEVNPRDLSGMPDAPDYVLIAVADRAVASVAEAISVTFVGSAVVAHTSGSMGMECIPESLVHRGVFYPLQTFTKGVELNYSDIPFFIEGSDRSTVDTLRSLAESVSPNVYEADSEKRRGLHLASVFACNFVNRLYAVGWDIMREYGLPPEALIPLVRQTAVKAAFHDPASVQTGPAARGDLVVMKRHMEMLSDNPDLMDIYELLSDSIMKNR